MASPPNSILDRKNGQAKEETEVDDATINNENGSRVDHNHSRSTGREGGASFSSSHTGALDTGVSGRASRSSSTIALVPSSNNRSGRDLDTIELRERTPSAGSTGGPRGEGNQPSGRRVAERTQPSDQEGTPRAQTESNPNTEDEDEDGNVPNVWAILVSPLSVLSKNLKVTNLGIE